MQFETRPYQTRAINAFFQAVRDGKKRVMMCAPTGAGKTVIAMRLIEHMRKHGKKVNFLVDRTVLVEQTSGEFFKYGIDHGVEAGANTFGRFQEVKILSAQTVRSRKVNLDIADINIVDEAHIRHKSILDQMGNGKVWLGLSASPFAEGLADFWDCVVNVTSTDALVESNNLAPLRIYRGVPMNISKKNSSGEYDVTASADEAMRIVGNVLEEWEAKTDAAFGGPVKTIVFSNTVDDGRKIAENFRRAGYDFESVSYLDDDHHKRRMIDALRRGDIMGLISCEMLQRGFDVPDILCGMDLHPWRKSLSSVVQQAGRAMRSHPGKDFALWLDFAQNMLRHRERVFDFWANGIDELIPMDKTAGEDKPDPKEAYCKECEAMMSGPVCDVCGWERPRPVRGGQATNGAEYVDGRLEALDGPANRPLMVKVGQREYEVPRPAKGWAGLCHMAKKAGRTKESGQRWAQANYRKLYGDFKRAKFDPKKEYDPPSTDLQAAVEHSTRLYVDKLKRESRKRA